MADNDLRYVGARALDAEWRLERRGRNARLYQFIKVIMVDTTYVLHIDKCIRGLFDRVPIFDELDVREEICVRRKVNARMLRPVQFIFVKASIRR